MATTLTTYFYNGANDDDTTGGFVTVNAQNYWTLYFEVAIFYGAYNGANVVPAVQPLNLPPLMNVAFNAKVHKANVGGDPLARYSAATLISRQDIFESSNPANCLGTKFIFASPIILENCDEFFCLVWSTNMIEMPYGPDMIFIAAQNGVTPPFMPCSL